MQLTAAGGATVKLHFAGNYPASSFELVQDKNGLSSIVATPPGKALADTLGGMASQLLHEAAPLPASTLAGLVDSAVSGVEHLAGLGGLFAALVGAHDAGAHGVAIAAHTG